MTEHSKIFHFEDLFHRLLQAIKWVIRIVLCCFLWFGLIETSLLQAAEVQQHGVSFEHWISDTFFDGYRAEGYTQKWDIPGEVNQSKGGIPVNPKATKFGTPIGLGDALRQFEVSVGETSFWLIVGYWEQASPERKEWVNVQAVRVTPQQWHQLWGPVTREDLEKLDQIVKNKATTIEEARAAAQAIKNKPPFTEAILQVNPKIDKSQRRLQCSLGFAAFFEHLAKNEKRMKIEKPELWGVPVPAIEGSGARVFPPEAPTELLKQ